VIIAALKQEMMPLLHDPTFSWRATSLIDVPYGAWESTNAVLICGGIGAKAATFATEQAVRHFHPANFISAGLAGALVPGLHVAQVIYPACVVNPSTGQRFAVPGGHGTLVTASEVAGAEGKRLLARHFDAECADMEAAAVAAIAEQNGIGFSALKSISDEYDFEMPDLNAFITSEGRFQTRRFATSMIARPRMWAVVRQLARNSRVASVELCRELRNLILQDTATNGPEPAGRPRESQPAR
jgi:adenosylhomocysteine nucleosidase